MRFYLTAIIGSVLILTSSFAESRQRSDTEIEIVSVIPRSPDAKPVPMAVPPIRSQSALPINQAEPAHFEIKGEPVLPTEANKTMGTDSKKK